MNGQYEAEAERRNSIEEHAENKITLFTEQEWDEAKELQKRYGIFEDSTQIHFCKLESHKNYLYATIKIPPKHENEVSKSFRFYLTAGEMIFIDNGNTISGQIEKITVRKLREDDRIERLLYDILVGFVEEDLLFLQELEREIAGIEEQVLKNCCPKFNIKMLALKKKISKFYRYYSQLTGLGQELLDNETALLNEEELHLFGRYRDRVERLALETQTLRDYAMQVQDVYQSEIEIRQNDVMKMLTVVTTIFLPLSLIAGWYGMNFAYMPELQMKYAYPVVIGISLFIVVFSLIVFKKKRYW